MKIQLVLAILVLILPFAAQSADITSAGFAFAGDYKSAATRFPFTFKLFAKQNGDNSSDATISYKINQRLARTSNPAMEFKTSGELVSLKSSDQVLMTLLMLTGETVVKEKFGEFYKTYVSLRGDALIFDYKNLTIVRSYPVSVVLFDASADSPSDGKISDFVSDLIQRDDEKGLISQYVKRLEAATLPSPNSKTVQIKKGVVSPEVLDLMPDSIKGNPAVMESILVDTFGSILSAKMGISMLPSSIGHAVGGVMTLRLESGDDYKLKVGEADFLIDIQLNKLVKIKASENNVGVAYVYGAYTTVKFYEPALGTAYLNTDLKNGETSVIPAGETEDDDFPAYQDAIRGLFLKITDSIQKPNTTWLAVSASAKDILKQLEATREIMRKCK